MVQAHDRRDEAQAEAAAGRRTALLEAHEALEDARAVGLGNAGAVVGDLQDEIVALPRRRDDDPGRRASPLPGVRT